MSDLELEHPDAFTVGTRGEPGSRVFYLQARQGADLVTLRLEKQQVAALAEYLGGLLADLPPLEGPLPEQPDLQEPLVAEWAVGSLAVAYRELDDRMLIVAEELVVVPDDADDDTIEALAEAASSVRLHLSRPQVAAFIPHAKALVDAGRPPCPLCGRPMDPGGHLCPRNN
ncbi:MAG: DUF3090 family protein [Acidimicrobiales bacterium]